MTAYQAWYLSFASARLLRENNLSAEQLKGVEDIFFQQVSRFDNLGLLPEVNRGFEDGVASVMFRNGLLEDKPVYAKPKMAEGESFFGGFRTEEWANPMEKERQARDSYFRD